MKIEKKAKYDIANDLCDAGLLIAEAAKALQKEDEEGALAIYDAAITAMLQSVVLFRDLASCKSDKAK